MNMKQINLFIILSVCGFKGVSAYTTDDAVTAKSLAHWNGFSAYSSDQGCINPASLNNDQIFSISSFKTPPDIVQQSFLLAFHKQKWNFQVEGLFTDYGLLKDFITGNVFSSNGWQMGISAKSTLLDILSFGLKLNWSGIKIDDWNTSSLALDAGIRTQLKNERSGIGIVLKNSGIYKTKHAGYGPQFLILGTYYRPAYFPGVLSLDFDNYSEWRGIFGLVISPFEEMKLYLSNTTDVWQLHTGSVYQNFISGFGLGIQINWRNYAFTFAGRNLGQGGWIKGLTLSTTLIEM